MNANAGAREVRQTGQLVRAPKTSELIADRLRRQIVRGVVKPGDKLPPETRLMEQFGVSRPTIREASGASRPNGCSRSGQEAAAAPRWWRPT